MTMCVSDVDGGRFFAQERVTLFSAVLPAYSSSKARLCCLEWSVCDKVCLTAVGGGTD